MIKIFNAMEQNSFTYLLGAFIFAGISIFIIWVVVVFFSFLNLYFEYDHIHFYSGLISIPFILIFSIMFIESVVGIVSFGTLSFFKYGIKFLKYVLRVK